MAHYRVLKNQEISERENLIAELASEVANFTLRIHLPNRSFFEETSGASDLKTTEPIRGLYQLHRVFIIRGLPDEILVDTAAHEVRHAWQHQKQKFRWKPQSERDAEMFAREFNIAIGQPSPSKIVERLITVRSMRVGDVCAWVRNILLKQEGELR